MTKTQKANSATFLATGTASIDAVDDAPLTTADVVRELKKEALDVYGTRGKFSDAMSEPDNTVGRYFRGEREMPAVGRPRWTLVAAFAKRDLARLASRDIQHLDVVTGSGSRRICQFIERWGRPGWPIRIGVVTDAAQPKSVRVDHVNGR